MQQTTYKYNNKITDLNKYYNLLERTRLRHNKMIKSINNNRLAIWTLIIINIFYAVHINHQATHLQNNLQDMQIYLSEIL